MASAAASAVPRSILRSAQRSSSARLCVFRRSLSITRPRRAGVVAPNLPPMEPHKDRSKAEMGVGEFEGTEFRIEPMRRTGEDDSTMRARLVYQSRKRGILETDLLLSTFADAYLPTMTREQMAQYDMFLDENDWDIYYWATQEPPATAASPAETSSSTSSPSTSIPSIATTDTSSADYAGGAEAAISEATPLASPNSTSTSASANPSPEPLSTGGSPRAGDASEGKEPPPTPTSTLEPGSTSPAAATAAASEEAWNTQRPTGEWAQTVGTFKPAYRPVPQRWRDSAVLALLRDHVRARAAEKGGMAFMPALRMP
ncbi:DUF339-domain-containing protein [Hypoxylon sp. NC1633]|nr:DUF339-domain-containing protein [Hypoxylon sp. NC1633]